MARLLSVRAAGFGFPGIYNYVYQPDRVTWSTGQDRMMASKIIPHFCSFHITRSRRVHGVAENGGPAAGPGNDLMTRRILRSSVVLVFGAGLLMGALP